MRLIDADAMHKFVEEKVSEGKDGWSNGVPYEWAYALTAADMQPTIDAVPVVRCRDCKNRWTEYCGMYFECACGIHESWETRNDFCSWGERKEVKE